MSEKQSPVETALKVLYDLERSLDELKKRAEAYKVEIGRLAEEKGQEAYRAAVEEAEREKEELISAVRTTTQAEVEGIISQGRSKVDSFKARAEAQRQEVRELIVGVLLDEA